MAKTISARQLQAKGGCSEQVALFRQLFGSKPVAVTEALCLEHASKFDWQWAASNLLSDAAREEYDRVMAPAWAEYDRVTDAARAEHYRVTAVAWAEYNRVTAAAWAEYNRVMDAARAEHYRARAAARAEHYRARAAAFCAALNSEE